MIVSCLCIAAIAGPTLPRTATVLFFIFERNTVLYCISRCSRPRTTIATCGCGAARGPPSGERCMQSNASKVGAAACLSLAFCFRCSPHCLLASFFPLNRKWQYAIVGCTVLQATRTKTLCRAACNFIIFSTRRWRCCHFFFETKSCKCAIWV